MWNKLLFLMDALPITCVRNPLFKFLILQHLSGLHKRHATSKTWKCRKDRQGKIHIHNITFNSCLTVKAVLELSNNTD